MRQFVLRDLLSFLLSFSLAVSRSSEAFRKLRPASLESRGSRIRLIFLVIERDFDRQETRTDYKEQEGTVKRVK